MGCSLNLGRLAHGLVRLPAALRVNEVGRKDSVDERRLSKTRLAYNHGKRMSKVIDMIKLEKE